ncbi:hypothetical protein ACNY68_04805 [Pantoea sp. KXB25]|uniref:hypothetical protein n=1 Tax=unclassified Pantoea TaxID=2630326 RepID=UPI003AB7A4E2
MHKLTVIIPWLMCASASADDCESIISLSRIVSETTYDKDAVEQNANYFCHAYSQGTSISNDSNFGASYKFLAASFGSSNVTVTEVASKYCSASDNYSKSRDAYKQYVQIIAPGAYEAYKQCTTIKKDMQFNVDSVLPAQFSMSVGFVSSDSSVKNASVSYSASTGVSCHWNNTPGVEKIIPTGSTSYIECNRTDQTQKAYVKIIRTDSATIQPLTLNWQAYDKNGYPLDTLKEFGSRLKALEMDMINLQKGSVVGFMSDNCPTGWTPVVNAQGRFLRGIDSSGSNNIDPSGKRTPGSIQEDMLKKHTHNYKSGFHDGQSNSGTGADPNKKDSTLIETDEGKSKDGDLGPETRPKNMAVLFCTKSNL